MLQQFVSKVGVVVIGRNESERLDSCLNSVTGQKANIVYVDSGSTDGSVQKARRAGVDVLELDPRTLFTAARARNEGFDRIRQLNPSLSYIQFVDGDCEIVGGWLEKGAAFLDAHPDVAVVCGRCRERNPTQSIYNMLCDVEWDTPIGEVKACLGIALTRVSAFEQVGGFRPDVIAAEDNEFCVRLRATGWRIWRLDEEMTVHDAAMTRFTQWWRRAVRAGYCFAQGAHLHGALPERHFVWESHRAWVWGFCLPLACLVCGLAFTPWGWAAWLVYPIQVLRLMLRNAGPLRQRALVAMFQVLARFPEGLGQVKFLGDRVFRRQSGIIEYK